MRNAVIFVFILIQPLTLFAAEWDIETLLAQDYLSEFAVSPDGKRLVWVQRSQDEDGLYYTYQLFLANLKIKDGPGEARQLTRHEADAYTPRWAPNGESIAFLSTRGEEAEQQVWLLDLRGGEPEALTEVEGGVEDFRWLDDSRLLYLAGEGASLRDTELLESEDDTWIVDDERHWPATRLFLLDRVEESTRRITTNTRPIDTFAISPNGEWVVYSMAESMYYDYDHKRPPTIHLHNLESGDSREILTPELRPFQHTWDLKSEGFYFLHPVGSQPGQEIASLSLPGYFDLATDDWREVDIAWDRGVGWGGLYPTNKGVLIDLFDGAANRLLHMERKGDSWKRRLLPDVDRGFVNICAVGPDGKRAVYRTSDASTPPSYFAAELTKSKFKDKVEFMQVNRFLEDLPRVRTELISWIGARGDSVEGLLHYPLDYVEGERHPLVVMVHGGPDAMDEDYFSEGWGGSPGMMASRGAFVLRPNYHGSGGYGLEWAESIRGRFYELEVPDILAGVDHLVAADLVDESRLGIQGWSNGAILGIAACIASGQRFRVLDAGAGDVNWTSDHGNCAFGAGFDNYYFGGPPWEVPWTYIDKSPLFRVQELQVPTLISFGTDDVSVPTEQGWQLFRAMQQVDLAPVRFALYPDEGHSLMSPVHRRRQMQEQMDWFDQWLFNCYDQPNEAFLTDSPLDHAIRLTDAARVNGFFGERLDSLLVPELVECDSLLVGRFEVTRGQWEAWRKAVGDTSVSSAGEEELDILMEHFDPNLPITNIAWSEALEYCDWLGAAIGLECRLPTSEELEGLQGQASGVENTLTWWAGYSPNREDAEELLEKVFELSVNHTLLHTVGAFAVAGETGLYDLGGNAAEWACDFDEEDVPTATALGGYALSCDDPFGEPKQPEAAYIGFRIVAAKPSEE
ncbi:MAG: prolyl oligopeptidase family serine peptidase [bacterium]|nr:prolyl oligopeptidase family serine peptidase [bacterium]